MRNKRICHSAKYVSEVFVLDTETNQEILCGVYKHENGGMFAVDASFIEQCTDVDENDEAICYIGDPFNVGDYVKLIEN